MGLQRSAVGLKFLGDTLKTGHYDNHSISSNKYSREYTRNNYMNTDISTMTETELKAMAYDLLVQNEQIQRSIQIINQEIAKRQKEIKVDKVDEVK